MRTRASPWPGSRRGPSSNWRWSIPKPPESAQARFSMAFPSSGGPLYRDGGGLAAADADRGYAAPEAARFERRQQRDEDACAGRSDGMPERAGAAVHVDLLVREAEF